MRYTYNQWPNQEFQGSLVYGGQYRQFSSSHDPGRKETDSFQNSQILRFAAISMFIQLKAHTQ